MATRARRRKTTTPVTTEGFGPRLVRLRQARGLTQEALGARVGLSNRMLAYYERDDAEPPGALLPALAAALEVSTDELLGVKPLGDLRTGRAARLLKRLEPVADLPPADQRAVLKLVDALVETRQRTQSR
ncbi:MAG: helix-turn-helix transcriptional regulator [Phycisphaerales bacterium]|nr:helix-turn-helix transcriptional regulator [Phycisphaerales bacterium]